MSGESTAADSRPTPDPITDAYKRDVDRTLLRENLKLTPEERFERLMKLQEFADALRDSRRTDHR